MSRRYYSDPEKMVAVELWAQGLSVKAVAEQTGISKDTLNWWRTKATPLDWHLYKADIVREAQEATTARLLQHQSEIHERHYLDWERIRQATLLAISVPTEDGKLRLRTDLTPKVLRDVATTYAQVQKGQRLALGIPSDFTITGTVDGPEELDDLGLGPDGMRQVGDFVAGLLSAAPAVIDIDDEEDPAEDPDAD